MGRLPSKNIEEYKKNVNENVCEYNPGLARNIFLIKLFGLMGVVVTMPFGILALFRGNTTLSMMLICISSVLILNYFFASKREKYAFSSSVIVYLFLCLFLYLVYSGGIENTGSLWIYVFPALALFLHGFKHGLIDIGIFVLGMIIILYMPLDAPLMATYNDEYKSRLLFSFVTVSFLASLYEYFSGKSFEQVCALSKKLIKVAKEEHLAELARKRGIGEEYELLFAYAKKHNESMSIVLADIDYLPDIKGRYGNDIGEMVIHEIKHSIENCIKNSEAIVRWSGAEFLILLPQTVYADACKFAEALEQRIKNMTLTHDGKPMHISLTTGVTDIENSNSIYAAIRNADSKMY
ncbi:MAG: GGDEF domain-containing protein [Epsilonproteobacteria bacterium]|nr:GGDEF domain-containing protein [Campylobacterota bacterium]